MKDINNRELKKGDIIDIHQTINGENKFVIMNISPLDIRYYHNLDYKYQYDVDELLKPCNYTGEVSFEIISNIHEESFIINKKHMKAIIKQLS